jgi:transcriptional regulator with XRE-family HTH domain
MAERLRDLRQRHNLRQKDLADKLGITESAYGYYEQGRRSPSPDALHTLAEVYDVTTDYLITGKSRDTHVAESRAPYKNDSATVPPEEREFLDWVKEHVTGTFFYDWKQSKDKDAYMDGLKLVWKMEKGRMPGQKQGE